MMKSKQSILNTFIYSLISSLTCLFLLLSLVYVLLEEILTSSIQRCTDPQLMETRVRNFLPEGHTAGRVRNFCPFRAFQLCLISSKPKNKL